MILTAGFKPNIKAKVLGANLRALADIKDLAMKTETLENEKKTKSNGTNFMVNQIKEEEAQEIDAVKFGSTRGGANGRNFRGGPSQYRGGGRGNFQSYRGGYDNPQRGGRGGYNNSNRGGGQQMSQPQNNFQNQSQRGNFNGYRGGAAHQNQSSNNGQQTKWCANCRKNTHNTAQCWGNKKNLNPVYDENQTHQDHQQDESQEEEEHINTFHIHNSKN